MQSLKFNINDIYTAAIAACQPAQVLREQIEVTTSSIRLGTKIFDRNTIGKLKLLAIGKAAAAMMQQAMLILQDCTTEALCITKHGHAIAVPHVRTIEAGHPIPDIKSVEAAEAVEQLLQGLERDDILLLLLSGGASSLIADLPHGTTLSDLQQVNTLLHQCGANIAEMNGVRKHLATLKGGQLAAKTFPATVVTLAISDVPGNDAATIGSGLTVADISTYADAINTLVNYRVWEKLPHTVQQYLHDGHNGLHAETPKPGELEAGPTHYQIIATNQMAMEAAADKSIQLGYQVQLYPDLLSNEVSVVAKHLAQLILHQAHNLPQSPEGDESLTLSPLSLLSPLSPLCLTAGGESTVQITGNGKGGRNMHLAALLLHTLDDTLPPESELRNRICLLAGGTDGTDGPTDAAGAWANLQMLQNSETNKSVLKDAIDRFDVYPFFEKRGGLLKTGPTQTNVMDLVIVLVKPDI